MDRAEVLEKAKQCVCEGREEEYGSPENNFNTIANMWGAYLAGKYCGPIPLASIDVAAMLAIVKIARIASGHAKADNWIDLAGYAACGDELESDN